MRSAMKKIGRESSVNFEFVIDRSYILSENEIAPTITVSYLQKQFSV